MKRARAKDETKVTTLSTLELSKFLRVTRETIQAWNRKGIPRERKRGDDGKTRSFYDLARVRLWLEEQGSQRAKDIPAGLEPATADNATAVAESALESLAALKVKLALAELRRRTADAARREHELSVRRGLFLDAADVEQGRLRRIAACKSGLLALPAKLGARCANRDSREVEQYAREEVEALLRAFAGGEGDPS